MTIHFLVNAVAEDALLEPVAESRIFGFQEIDLQPMKVDLFSQPFKPPTLRSDSLAISPPFLPLLKACRIILLVVMLLMKLSLNSNYWLSFNHYPFDQVRFRC